jgi:hypothetical protein
MPGALELRRIFVESAAAPAERIALLAKSLKAMLSQNPRAFPAALACVCQWLSPDAYREVLNGIEPSQHRTAS